MAPHQEEMLQLSARRPLLLCWDDGGGRYHESRHSCWLCFWVLSFAREEDVGVFLSVFLSRQQQGQELFSVAASCSKSLDEKP